MNARRIGLILISFTFLLLMKCSEKQEILLKPSLFITLKDSARIGVSGATVRLYKNARDSGIVQISDTSGFALFNDLEAEVYYWYAEKGCLTNRNSQTTLNRPLIQGVILYGYSVMSQSGTLKITNISAERYKVRDSIFNSILRADTLTLSADTTYIAYPKVGSHIIHSEKVSEPGIGKDTLVEIRCGDTTSLILPY